MRLALALVSLFAISCSTSNKYIFHCDSGECCPAFVDTDDDGLPDKRISAADCCPEQGDDVALTDFENSDCDSLPDQRVVELVLVDDEDGSEHRAIVHERAVEVREVRGDSHEGSDRNERLERALDDLQRAIENVRRAMR